MMKTDNPRAVLKDAGAEKKPRIWFSCSSCRGKKIKCDRERPRCNRCIKSGSECHYDPRCGDGTKFLVFDVRKDKAKKRRNSEREEDDVDQVSNNRHKQKVHHDLLQIKNILNELERKLEQEDVSSSQRAGDVSSLSDRILDEPMAALKPNSIHHKKSRTHFFGPLTFRTSLAIQGAPNLLINNFVKNLESERKSWKARLGYSSPLGDNIFMQENSLSIEELCDKLAIVIPRFQTIQERLDYFKNNLLQFFPFVDYNTFYQHFELIFKQSKNGGLEFNLPTAQNLFSNVALAIGILKLAILLSKPEKQKFLYELDDSDDALYRLFLDALSNSRFMKKQSMTTLQCLLILHAMQTSDLRKSNGGDDSNSYLYYQLSLSMALSLGLHRDPDNIYFFTYKGDDELPFNTTKSIWRETWRYIYLFDSFYSITIGTPLLINESFTDCQLDKTSLISDIQLEYVELVRSVAFELSTSVKPISFNEIIVLLEKVQNFMLFKLDTSESLLTRTMEDTRRKDYIYRQLDMKLDLLTLSQAIIRSLGNCMSNIPFLNKFRKAGPLAKEDINCLKRKAELYESHLIKNLIFSFYLISEIVSRNSLLSKNPCYLLLLLPKIRKLLLNSTFAMISYCFTIGKYQSQNDKPPPFTQIIDTSEVFDLNLSNLGMKFERLLGFDVSINSGECEVYQKIVERSIHDMKRLMTFVCEFTLKCTRESLILKNDYSFFIVQRVLIYFCHAVEALSKDSSSFAATPQESTRILDGLSKVVRSSVEVNGKVSENDMKAFIPHQFSEEASQKVKLDMMVDSSTVNMFPVYLSSAENGVDNQTESIYDWMLRDADFSDFEKSLAIFFKEENNFSILDKDIFDI